MGIGPSVKYSDNIATSKVSILRGFLCQQGKLDTEITVTSQLDTQNYAGYNWLQSILFKLCDVWPAFILNN